MCIRNRTLNYDSALRENWTISRCFLSLRTASKLCPICCVCSMAQRFCNLTRSESNPGGGEDDTRTWQRAEHSVEWCCCKSPNTEVVPFTRSRFQIEESWRMRGCRLLEERGLEGGISPEFGWKRNITWQPVLHETDKVVRIINDIAYIKKTARYNSNDINTQLFSYSNVVRLNYSPTNHRQLFPNSSNYTIINDNKMWRSLSGL